MIDLAPAWSRKNRTSRTDVRTLLVHVTGDRIGDALLKWPVLAAIKKAAPDLQIIWVAGLRKSVFKGPLASLVQGILTEVHESCGVGTSWREMFFPILHHHYDTIIATEQRLRSALALKRIPHTVFISPAWKFRFSDRRPSSAYPDSAYQQFLELAALALGARLEPEPHVPIPEELALQATQLLPAGATYIGFVPGAAGVKKRWPLERFIQIANEQSRRGRTPVFFLGPEEQAWHASISEQVPSALFPELEDGTRRGGPLLTIALATRLSLGVANDSGGGHLLAAGRRPLLSLFGHTNEQKFKPPYGPCIALRAKDFGGDDVALIPIDAVSRAIEQTLSSHA